MKNNNKQINSKYQNMKAFLILVIILVGFPAYATDLTISPPDIDFQNKCIKKELVQADDFDWSEQKIKKLTSKQLFELLELYYYGSSNTAPNMNRAIKLIDYLSNRNSKYRGKALKIKAFMLIEGKGVPEDTEKAILILKNISQKYNMRTDETLAKIYYNKGDYAKASEYYKQAAVTFNSPSAALAVAHLYDKKLIEASDNAAEQMLIYAQNLILQHIAQGNCKILLNIGSTYLYMNDKNKNIHKDNNEKEHNNYQEKSKAIAIEWYRAAEKANYVEAKLRLAKLIKENNIDISDNDSTNANSNEQEVLKLWNEAADMGSARAMYKLAKYFLENATTEHDYNNAYLWLERAAEKNHVKSILKLSRIYRKKGRIDDATKMLKKAAKYHSIDAMLELSRLYTPDGWGLSTDRKKAIFWLEKAVGNNPSSIKSTIKIADLYNKIYGENNKKTIEWQKKVGELYPDDIRNKHRVAVSILNNAGQTNKSQKNRAITMLNELVNAGSQESIIYLANLYLSGYEDIVKRNPSTAIKLLEKAASNGDVKSMIELSNIYMSGMIAETSFSKAIKWLEKAEVAGSEQARNRLKWLRSE